MSTFLRSMRRIGRAKKLLTALQWLSVLRLLLTAVQSVALQKKG